MAQWLQSLIGAAIGFFAGRLGSAVDHELRSQHHIRTTIPALLEAQRATNTALDVITQKLNTMQQSELELRGELQQFRTESSNARRSMGEAVREQSRRIDRLDRRFDAMSDAQGVLYPRRLPLDPHLPATAAPTGSHTDCPAGHWVPPLDRPDWGRQTEPEEEPP